MRILHRHIQATLITMIALVLLITSGLVGFIDFINQLNELGTKNYTVWPAFKYVILSLPNDTYPLFPAAALIGSLIGLGRLAAQSELIVMRAAGVSKTQIIRSVMTAAILLLIAATVIGEWLGPRLKDIAEQHKTIALTGTAGMETRSGVWLRDKENFIYIHKALPTGQLQGIMRYHFDQQRLLSLSTAKSADYQNQQWTFHNVHETVFHPDHITTQQFDQRQWPVIIDYRLVAISNIQPNQTSLIELHRYIRYLTSVGLSANAYEFNFWKRVLQPLVALVMIGLAIPIIFGPLRTVTMGLRILIGVIIGFGVFTLNEFLGPFSLVYQVPPLWAAAAPLILFMIIDAILLWRVR